MAKNQAVCGAKDCKKGGALNSDAIFTISPVHRHFDTASDVGIYVNRRMLQRSNAAQSSAQGAGETRLPANKPAETRRRMSSGKRTTNILKPTRRELLTGAAALSATAMLAPQALAQQFPTANVNTTALAVTDSEVTVGILHSVTVTMAISET